MVGGQIHGTIPMTHGTQAIREHHLDNLPTACKSHVHLRTGAAFLWLSYVDSVSGP